jgi:hypothetical protein
VAVEANRFIRQRHLCLKRLERRDVLTLQPWTEPPVGTPPQRQLVVAAHGRVRLALNCVQDGARNQFYHPLACAVGQLQAGALELQAHGRLCAVVCLISRSDLYLLNNAQFQLEPLLFVAGLELYRLAHSLSSAPAKRAKSHDAGKSYIERTTRDQQERATYAVMATCSIDCGLFLLSFVHPETPTA